MRRHHHLEEVENRTLVVGKPNLERCDNKISTSKYTLLTFLPIVSTFGLGLGIVEATGSGGAEVRTCMFGVQHNGRVQDAMQGVSLCACVIRIKNDIQDQFFRLTSFPFITT